MSVRTFADQLRVAVFGGAYLISQLCFIIRVWFFPFGRRVVAVLWIFYFLGFSTALIFHFFLSTRYLGL